MPAETREPAWLGGRHTPNWMCGQGEGNLREVIACPRCGTPNDPSQEICWGCGLTFAKPAPRKTGLSGTVIQGSPPTWPDADASANVPQAGAPAGKRTMLGMAPTNPFASAPAPPATPPPPPATPPPPRGTSSAPPRSPYSTKQTMIGVAPASLPAAPPAKHTMLGIAPEAAPMTMPSPEDAPAKQTGRRGTLLGVAPAGSGSQRPPQPAQYESHAREPRFQSTQPFQAPQLQPPPVQAPPPPEQPSQAPHPTSRSPSQAPLPSEKRTAIGVAMPGIAPLNPGLAKPPSTPPAAAPGYVSQPARPTLPQGTEPTTEDLAVLPGHGRTRSWRLWVFLLIFALVVLAGGAVAAFLLLRAAPALDARVTVDAQGREQLELACPTCDNGSVARLGGARATFASGKAVLALAQPLRIGNNELSVELQTPSRRLHRAELHVPVEYRVRGDFGSLSATPPQLAVRVEAVPGTAVIVDGKAIALGPDGTGKYLVDVSKELTGPAPRVERLERKLIYSITPPGSAPRVGEAVLQLGITALIVDAPGKSVVTESPNFMLAGRTLKGGSIHVEGRPITVDPQGRFAQLMNVSAVGQTTITVRASAPDHAPRLFPVEVQRVESLRAHAKSFAEKAADSYSAIATNISEKRGCAVALAGRVADARSEGHTSIILLEVSKGCAKKPCLARLLHGARSPVSQGDRATAYGYVTGAVDGPRAGDQIPEIRVDFLLPDES